VRSISWFLLPVALAAGAILPVQFAVNSHLRSFVGGPVAAAAVLIIAGVIVVQRF
jgi:uncharacterized membrane protein YdcZ (DUF606 family)